MDESLIRLIAVCAIALIAVGVLVSMVTFRQIERFTQMIAEDERRSREETEKEKNNDHNDITESEH